MKKLDRKGKYIYVGKYDFGNKVVGLLAEVGEVGGSFCCSFANEKPSAEHPNVEGMDYIVVGIAARRWRGVFDILMHEANEMAYTDVGCRFNPSPNFSHSHASYHFAMNHEQFAEANSRAAMFMAACQNDLSKVWKKVRGASNTK